MKQEFCLISALCLLMSFLDLVTATEDVMKPGPLAVAMATEDVMKPGPLTVAMATEDATKPGPLAVAMATEDVMKPGPLAVAMATEDATKPGPQAVAMATEDATKPGPLVVAIRSENITGLGLLSPEERDWRQSSLKSSSEHEQRAVASNSSSPAAEGGHTHILLSLTGTDKHVMKSSMSASQVAESKMPSETTADSKTSGTAVPPYDSHEDRGRLLVAVARTLVTTTASTTTLTVLSTCHNHAIPSTVCTGRKKRKTMLFRTMNFDDGQLDSSFTSNPVLHDDHDKKSARLILWTSSTSVVVFTVTSTDGGTIVKASFPCSFAGIVSCA